MHQSKALFSYDVKCQGLFKSDHAKVVKVGHSISPVPAEGFAVQHSASIPLKSSNNRQRLCLLCSGVKLELSQRNEEPGITCGPSILLTYPYSGVVLY